MEYTITAVKALDNFRLLLQFKTGERKIYNMKPHLKGGIFAELKDQKLFAKVYVCFDTIQWANGADFDPEVLYHDSRPE